MAAQHRGWRAGGDGAGHDNRLICEHGEPARSDPHASPSGRCNKPPCPNLDAQALVHARGDANSRHYRDPGSNWQVDGSADRYADAHGDHKTDLKPDRDADWCADARGDGNKDADGHTAADTHNDAYRHAAADDYKDVTNWPVECADS